MRCDWLSSVPGRKKIGDRGFFSGMVMDMHFYLWISGRRDAVLIFHGIAHSRKRIYAQLFSFFLSPPTRTHHPWVKGRARENGGCRLRIYENLPKQR